MVIIHKNLILLSTVTSAFLYSITSRCIIPGIRCSKLWVSSAASITVGRFRKVTTLAVICCVTLNRINVVHDDV